VQSRPWDAIEAHFLDLIEHGFKHERFVELIRHVKSSGLSQRIYGVTSLDRLLIGATENIDFDKDNLHITFDREKEEWSFEYYSIPYRQPEYSRKFPAEDGCRRLDRFIKMIGW
jgi:hypothetical protein